MNTPAMKPDVSKARALIRQARGLRTVYLVRRPTSSEPEITLDVPCGQTRAVALGRWPPDATPTEEELAYDIRLAMSALSGPPGRGRPGGAFGGE